MWDRQVNYFRGKYRVITYDIRGLGYSNELEDYQFTMEELVNDLFDIIDHLKLDKVNACGLSIGGYILLRALVRDQDRFRSVILADTKAESDDNTALIGRSNSIIKIKSGKEEEFKQEFLKKALSEESYRNKELKEFVMMIMNWMDVKGLCAVMIAIATRTNTLYQLRDIRTPALVIVGRNDILTPVTNSFFLKEGLVNSTFKVLEGSGHFSNMEKPEEFNSAVDEFLNKPSNVRSSANEV
jgi:pimeloyl-ACP methyl ester carboxylesterase